MDFYRKVVRCTYTDLARGTIGRGIAGTPQGGTVPPTLSNIVLHELDQWISSGFAESGKTSGKPNQALNAERYALTYLAWDSTLAQLRVKGYPVVRIGEG
jgi:hypothetical protein